MGIIADTSTESFIPEENLDGFDQTLHRFAAKAERPFWWFWGNVRYRFIAPLDPNKFENAASKAREVATRVLIALSAIVSFAFAATHVTLLVLGLGVVCKVSRAAAIALQKGNFVHVRGTSPEKTLNSGVVSVMTWNIAGDHKGKHYEKGVVQWRLRLNRLEEAIRDREKDPDVLILEGVDDDLLKEELVSRFKDLFAHGYIHNGSTVWNGDSGCVVFTKCAVAHFSHTNFENNASGENKGFSELIIKTAPNGGSCLRIIGTELSQGAEAQFRREEQMTQIINSLKKESKAILPTLFVGNANADRDNQREAGFLSKYLYHGYQGAESTHTGELAFQWNGRSKEDSAISDFISLFKPKTEAPHLPTVTRGVRLNEWELVRGFNDAFDTQTALSPNHGVYVKIELPSQKVASECSVN